MKRGRIHRRISAKKWCGRGGEVYDRTVHFIEAATVRSVSSDLKLRVQTGIGSGADRQTEDKELRENVDGARHEATAHLSTRRWPPIGRPKNSIVIPKSLPVSDPPRGRIRPQLPDGRYHAQRREGKECLVD